MAAPNNAADSCDKTAVNIHRCISILPNDYANLENIPSIGGVTLLGKMKASDLNLLSSVKQDYEPMTLEDIQAGEGYLVVIMPDSPPKTISINDLRAEAGGGGGENGGFQTVDEIAPDIPIGSYLFVEKK